MKTIQLSCILLFCLLLVGCGVEGETATAVPTRVAVVTNTAVPPTPTTLPATDTAVPSTATISPTNTATSLPATPTSTAFSTAVPTETPTITPTPLSPPPGKIYFFWDPKNLPRGEVIDPVQNLYLISGKTGNGLEISPVVNEIIGWPYISLSPDKTTFVYPNLEDRNGDGHISFEGYSRGFDGPNVFVFSRSDSSVARITSDYPIILNPEWGADGQTILYGQSTDALSSINVADGSLRLIAPFPENQIRWTDVSPDGRLVALNLDSIQISIVDTQTGEVRQITNQIGGIGVERAWSPDSKWLILSQPITNQLFLVNVETLTASPLTGFDAFTSFAWKPDSQQLAFVQDAPEGSNLMLLNLTDLSIRQILSVPGNIYSLLWSPDNLQLAMAISEEEEVALGILDTENNSLHELWQNEESRRFSIPAWSPDGEWLLFFHGRGWPLSHGPDDEAGLYLIHQSGGEANMILDTSNTSDPYGFFWLPEIQVP